MGKTQKNNEMPKGKERVSVRIHDLEFLALRSILFCCAVIYSTERTDT